MPAVNSWTGPKPLITTFFGIFVCSPLQSFVVNVCTQKYGLFCSLLIEGLLHVGGGPQVGEVTCDGSPYLLCKYDQIKMRDMDRRVTSPTWGSPPPCKNTRGSSEISRIFNRNITFILKKKTNKQTPQKQYYWTSTIGRHDHFLSWACYLTYLGFPTSM